MFTAEARENLGKRLLWVDLEVEFSNGAVRKFKNVSFHILVKGIEADVRKLDALEIVLPGDELKDPKPIEITKLKILDAACK